MDRQLGFFAAIRSIRPADPGLTAAERKRLTPKCKLILDRLRTGPASNLELARINHRFGGRIWDLRQAGCVIATDHDRDTGACVYTLTYEPDGL